MRWVLDTIAGVCVLGIAAGAYFATQGSARDTAALDRMASEVRRLQLQVKYRAATETAELNAWGWPRTIEPEWFEEDPPKNGLLPPAHPWLEVAGEAEHGQEHPNIRLAVDESVAGLWYNPSNGVVRARVPVTVNDAQALATYNHINGTDLASLFNVDDARESARARPAGGEPAGEGAVASGAPDASGTAVASATP